MVEKIKITGIETNNLKNIDISLDKKALNLIVGPSGSGKSSLAYDTVAQIGQHEFMSMFADNIAEPGYRIGTYSNMVAAIPIKQSNHNNNLHSTIGTYFGLNRNIGLLYASKLGMPEDFFTLNKLDNLCDKCHGLGFVNVLDDNRIIDYDTPINKNPIRCWNRYKDFYAQILEAYCNDNKIDSSKTYRQLNKKERNAILYGESQNKYSIKYKKLNSYSRRTSKYYGPMIGKPMMVGFVPGKQFFVDKTCDVCNGKKYSKDYENYKINGLSIGTFMTTSFTDLLPFVDDLMTEINDQRLTFALMEVRRFIDKAIELNLGHLCFHRAIPTLSGGELQRLRMVQVFNSQLTDLLIILDEPLAGLSGREKESIYDNIIKLSKKHSVLVVDHSDAFVKESKQVIALGPGGGIKGGELIDAKKYLANESVPHELKIKTVGKIIPISVYNDVYQYKGVELNIAEGCMNLITGRSGVGKSTLLREYFPQQFEGYTYISQKPLMGNKNSSVATALDIFDGITIAFSKEHKKDKKFFSNMTGNDGACPICGGAGYLEYGYDARTKMRLSCNECGGTGFNKILKKYLLNKKSIFDVWNMTIDESVEYFSTIDSKISNVLKQASELLLGHLKIGQATSTLSGGENIRVKLLKYVKQSNVIIGIDEPFRGLSQSEVLRVAEYLNNLSFNGKTIVVVDHTEFARRYFIKQIELINKDGLLVDSNQ